MSAEKSLAIVLRVVDFSESSCVVTLFSRDFGKIAALAKGARRPKSPFEAALDLLAVCRIVFIHKSTDVLDLLTEAKLERRFRSATRDLSRLYAGYYVAELLKELTDLGDTHPKLFAAADQTLCALDQDAEIAPAVLRFEMIALREVGHLPSLDQCASCGEQVEASGRIPFGQLAGGVLCRSCRAGKRQVASVTAGVIEALKTYSQPDDQAWRTAGLDPAVRGELRGVLNQYINNLIGQRPRLQSYLGSLAD